MGAVIRYENGELLAVQALYFHRIFPDLFES